MVVVKVPDMMCESCEKTIRQALLTELGVETPEVDLQAKTVTVPGEIDPAKVQETIRAAGFTPELA